MEIIFSLLKIGPVGMSAPLSFHCWRNASDKIKNTKAYRTMMAPVAMFSTCCMCAVTLTHTCGLTTSVVDIKVIPSLAWISLSRGTYWMALSRKVSIPAPLTTKISVLLKLARLSGVN